MSKNAKGIVCIVLAACFWGVYPSFNRLLLAGGFSTMQIVSIRAFVAGVIYLFIGITQKNFKGLKIRDIPFFLFYGLTAVFGTYLFYALAIKHLSAAMAGILLYTAPAFVIIFSRIFYGDKITGIKLASLCLTFLGSFLVVKAYDFNALNVNFVGIIYGILAGISYAMLTVVGRKGLKKYSQQLNSYLPTIIVAVIMTAVVPPWTVRIGNATNALYFLAISIFGSVLPYFFYLKGLSYGVNGGNAVLIANVEPLVATICGVAFFSDGIELLQIAGIGITLLGAGLIAMKGDS